MAALKAKYAGQMDFAKASAAVKKALAGWRQRFLSGSRLRSYRQRGIWRASSALILALRSALEARRDWREFAKFRQPEGYEAAVPESAMGAGTPDSAQLQFLIPIIF